MDILMLQKEVLGRQGVLGRIYGQNRDLSLTDYAAGWKVASGGQVSDFGEFLSSVELLAASLYGEKIAAQIARQLSQSPLASTVDHHGIFNHPFFLNSNLIYSLRPDLEYLVCFSTAGVSLNNSSWPGSLLITGQDGPVSPGPSQGGQMRRFSFFPDRIKTQAVLATQSFGPGDAARVSVHIQKADFLSEDNKLKLLFLVKEIFQDPKLFELRDFSQQAAVVSRLLWSKIFPTAPQLIYLPIEELVSLILSRGIIKHKDHLLYRLFFTESGWEIVEKYFQGTMGAFTQPHFLERINSGRSFNEFNFNKSDRNCDKKSGAGFTGGHKGSFIFWGVDKNRRRVHLSHLGRQLADRDFVVPLDPGQISQLLSAGQLYPSSLACFITLLYFGVTCLGGFNQVNWLAEIKQKFIDLLTEWGETEIKGRIEKISTDNFAEGNLAFGLNSRGQIYKPTALDLFLESGSLMYERYHGLASQMTLGESINTQLPEIYRVITPASGRRTELLAIGQADIIGQGELEHKIRRALL
jgi:hypothetical protein